MRIDVAGLHIDNVTVAQTLEKITQFVKSGRPHYLVTAYSEFVVEATNNPKYKAVLNNSDLSLPDGIGILWAAKFLSQTKKDPFSTIVHWIISLFQIVLAPLKIRSVIKEQVTGSRLIYDIAALAEQNGFSLALVGGFDDVAEQSAKVLKNKYPNLKINLAYNPEYFDERAVFKIAQSQSDILLIAYQPPKQEIWLAENLPQLNVKVAIGLGGTFDYLAGKRQPAPNILHYLGLEWFWRMVTQPWRIKRMWRAIIVFSFLVLKYQLKK